MKTPAAWNEAMKIGPTEELPRQVWMYWEDDNGKTSTRKYIKRKKLNETCFQMWPKLNPRWNVTVLSREIVERFFPVLESLFKTRPRTVQARSDMVRIMWLAKFGGVWADASLLPLRPLDAFVHKLVTPSGFFAWRYPPPVKRRIASWFLAAKPGNELVTAWCDRYVSLWKHQTELEYFQVHYALNDVIDNNRSLSRKFLSMPFIDSSWPNECIGGCIGYWSGPPKDRPPMLKRPFEEGEPMPDDWLAGYDAEIR